jgi:hypothetical protein
MEYVIVKWLHILSSTLLFGTGLGSAFYMFFASRTRDARAIAVVVRYVVVADWAFTTPTMIVQPLTGFYLVHLAGFPLAYWPEPLGCQSCGCRSKCEIWRGRRRRAAGYPIATGASCAGGSR